MDMLPRPGMAKNASMIRLPMNRNGIRVTALVSMGIIAFLRTCRNMTTGSVSPLARAVRT